VGRPIPDDPIALDAWEPGMRSLVRNLLENAARHGGGRVRVTLRDRELAVEDDGPAWPTPSASGSSTRSSASTRTRRAAAWGSRWSSSRRATTARAVTVERSEALGGALFRVAF
jgi:hypothetical protein